MYIKFCSCTSNGVAGYRGESNKIFAIINIELLCKEASLINGCMEEMCAMVTRLTGNTVIRDINI